MKNGEFPEDEDTVSQEGRTRTLKTIPVQVFGTCRYTVNTVNTAPTRSVVKFKSLMYATVLIQDVGGEGCGTRMGYGAAFGKPRPLSRRGRRDHSTRWSVLVSSALWIAYTQSGRWKL